MVCWWCSSSILHVSCEGVILVKVILANWLFSMFYIIERMQFINISYLERFSIFISDVPKKKKNS